MVKVGLRRTSQQCIPRFGLPRADGLAIAPKGRGHALVKIFDLF